MSPCARSKPAPCEIFLRMQGNRCSEMQRSEALRVYIKTLRDYPPSAPVFRSCNLDLITTLTPSPTHLIVLILNPPRTLRIDKAPPTAIALRTPLPSKVTRLCVGALAFADAAAHAEEDGGDEEAGERRPCEGVGVDADAGGLVVFAECIAGEDRPGAV